jgi:uncharacterized protein (TIGR00730 family)
MPKPEKAYKNLEFLTSPDGRLVRVLSEFLEPQARFRRQHVRDTVVFFGSARTLPPEVAAARHQEAKDALAAHTTPENVAAERHAEKAVALSRYYAEAMELADRMTRWALDLDKKGGRFVVCSGGGPGIMEAANRGAREAGGKTVALNISLPMEQAGNPYQYPGLDFEFHYFFVRKFWFMYLAKALVVFPGGFGTFDELFEILTLIQTGKTAKRIPVVIFGSEYWRSILNFEALADWGMIHQEDLDLFKFCDSVDEAFAYLTSELVRLHLAPPDAAPMDGHFPTL